MTALVFPLNPNEGDVHTFDNGVRYKFSNGTWSLFKLNVTESAFSSTNDLKEGTVNKYFTENRVLSTILTSLNVATNAVICASDSVLTALGKLQAQITANATAIASKVSKDVANVFTKPQTPSTGTVSVAAGSTFNYDPLTHGQVCTITVTGAGAITLGAPSNIVDGTSYKLKFVAGDTSARTLTFNSAFKHSDGTAPLTTLSVTSGARDVIAYTGETANVMVFDGSRSNIR